MTDKELRRLKRAELLEILFYLRRENDALKEEIRQIREQQMAACLPDNFTEQLRMMIREAFAAERSDGQS